eukprot:6674139-Prymnesium_polylepis.2
MWSRRTVELDGGREARVERRVERQQVVGAVLVARRQVDEILVLERLGDPLDDHLDHLGCGVWAQRDTAWAQTHTVLGVPHTQRGRRRTQCWGCHTHS